MSRTTTAELNLPNGLDGLKVPGRPRDMLAARIELGRVRRRLLWVGLFLTAVGAAAWAVLSRRPSELPPLSAPATPVPESTSNGKAPSPSGGSR
ncbi:MAG TPA: hypothetical protein VGD73_13910 [Pseudonocardia sp.]|uniref:hypothetical protein n=1 Tax=Pseudonocardia sp. TaxID=60912 RepID=UPI002ED909DE